MLDVMTLHAISIFLLNHYGLVARIKKKMLISTLMHVYDICTVMCSGVAALKSATMLRTAITEFLSVW